MNTTQKNPMNRLKQPIPKSLLIAGFSCMMGTSLYATDFQWTGASSNDYLNAANWSPAGFTNDFNNWNYIETPGANVTQSGGSYTGGVMVGSASGAPAVLNITQRLACN